MKKRDDSRAMSTVLATLLIIMLSIVAIIIVWVVIKNVIVNQSEIVEIKKEFFAENVEISALKIDGSSVKLSLTRKGGQMRTETTKEVTETVVVVETDIISVVDLSGSMTQCIDSSFSCCMSNLKGTSFDNDSGICYGANTTKSADCTSICKGNFYLIGGRSAGTFTGYAWTGINWRSNSGITLNLPDIGSYSAPNVFQKDGTWYLIAGESGGNFKGFSWDGTQWLPNSTINKSLSDIGSYSAPNVFQKDGTWYLIAGESGGNFKGFAWNGTNWLPNSTINASLPDVGSNSAPFVFYKDSSWYLIAGEYDGVFNGYVWDNVGNRWNINLTINALLPDIGYNSTPIVFYKDSSWYLISGNSGGTFNGYTWNGANWVANNTIFSGLGDIGSNSIPFVFYKNSVWLDRLTPTKEANKALIISLLSVSEENRIGFVAYSNDVIDSASLDLTNNAVLLNNKIDSWQPLTGTCICCGINEAADRLQAQSPVEKSRKIIIMSDGEANVECPSRSGEHSVEDAIQAADDAHNSTPINSTVYSIGAGENVDEDTLRQIAGHGGGKYYSAINVSDLVEVYRSVAEEIKTMSIVSNRFNYLYIVFYNETSSYRKRITEMPDNLGTKSYTIDLEGKLEGKLIKIEVYPVILLKSGKEEIGPLFDSWTLQG